MCRELPTHGWFRRRPRRGCSGASPGRRFVAGLVTLLAPAMSQHLRPMLDPRSSIGLSAVVNDGSAGKDACIKQEDGVERKGCKNVAAQAQSKRMPGADVLFSSIKYAPVHSTLQAKAH